MKGISPMIATILLIAFTVAVGVTVSVWMTGYASTTGGSVSGATENQTACIGTYPRIVTVTDDTIIITNPGSEEITSLSCYTSDGSSLTPGSTTLSAGGSTSVSWSRGSNTSVVCTGKCRNIGVSGECKSGYACWS